jgi:hypothetical protein
METPGIESERYLRPDFRACAHFGCAGGRANSLRTASPRTRGRLSAMDGHGGDPGRRDRRRPRQPVDLAYLRQGGRLDPDQDAARFWAVGDILGFLPDPAHILAGWRRADPTSHPPPCGRAWRTCSP